MNIVKAIKGDKNYKCVPSMGDVEKKIPIVNDGAN